MCGNRFDNSGRREISHEEHQQQQESASSSMSGYSAQEIPYLPWPTSLNPALITASPFQWTNPSSHLQTTGGESLLTCMGPNKEASPGSSSYSGFHCSPLQFSYDRSWESAVADAHGSKRAVGLNVEHKPNNMLRPRQFLVNRPSGLLMDGFARERMMNVTEMTAQEIMDAKALAASKSHSEAERRRRERINAHLATLRSLLPSTIKTDKASLLAEVIDHVKDLKRQASEIAEGCPVPTETDELTVDSDPSCGNGRLLIKASLCCDDRPELLSDIVKALRNLRLRTLKAKIATVEGRVKNVLLVTNVGEATDDNNINPSVSCIQEALKSVMERPNSEDLSPGNSIGIKRQRLTQFGSNASLHHILDHRSI